MEFISLYDLMNNLAAESQAGNEAARYSEAAAGFHQALHNATVRPHWFETGTTGQALRSDDATAEGMGMLLHMAAWATRDRHESLQHVHDCINSGLDPADVPRGYDMATGKYANANLLRAQAIGFDRKEINNLLGKKDNRLIEIPAGTQIVKVVEIIQKAIGQASPPLPPRGLSVVSLQKRFTLEPKHYKDEDLTDDDCGLLESIKCDSPITDWFPMTNVQFDELKALFESAPNKPEWGLSAVPRDYYSVAKAERSIAFSNHLNNIETLVKDGQLNLIQETGDPIKLSNTQGVGLNAFFTIDDARAYLKTCGFQLVETGNEPAEPQAKPVTEKQGRKVRQIATILEHVTAMGYPVKNIPRGGKVEIYKLCLEESNNKYHKNNGLFTHDGFEDAWGQASERGLLSVANKDQYTNKC